MWGQEQRDLGGGVRGNSSSLAWKYTGWPDALKDSHVASPIPTQDV